MKEEIQLVPETAAHGSGNLRNQALEAPERFVSLRSRAGWYCGILIALFFALWGLRSVGANTIVDTDAARHAMNGAFLHDLIVRGKFTGILQYAHMYYAHLPALSMPYHPPLFPAIEAVFFFIFGVNVLAARLAIALAVALSGSLLFRLVIATHDSVFLAALSTTTFLSLTYVMWLSCSVMLEFPAMVFMLWSLHLLWKSNDKRPMLYLLAFGVLAGAAVWVKQQAVFVGAVPFLYAALAGHWKLLRRPAIWASALVFGILLFALTLLSVPFHGAGVNQAAPPHHSFAFYHNLLFYVTNYHTVVGPAGIILMIAFVIALASRVLPRTSTAFYSAWAGSAFLVLLLIGPYNVRYLFFALPALVVLGYTSLWSLLRKLLPGRERWGVAPCLTVLVISLVGSYPPPNVYLKGPSETAKILAGTGAHRILYCGGTDGNFMFSYRSARPGLDTVILAGDKLPKDFFAPASFERFAQRFGIEYLVLERSTVAAERSRHPWSALLDSVPASMHLKRSLPLASSVARWNGTLDIYQFAHPSVHPDNDLTMRMNMIGGSMQFSLDQ